MNSFLFELVVGDGAYSGDQGAAVGNKFAADPVMAVTGGNCSGETFGPKLVLHRGNMVFAIFGFADLGLALLTYCKPALVAKLFRIGVFCFAYPTACWHTLCR